MIPRAPREGGVESSGNRGGRQRVGGGSAGVVAAASRACADPGAALGPDHTDGRGRGGVSLLAPSVIRLHPLSPSWTCPCLAPTVFLLVFELPLF